MPKLLPQKATIHSPQIPKLPSQIHQSQPTKT